jgi:hypothetical protein
MTNLNDELNIDELDAVTGGNGLSGCTGASAGVGATVSGGGGGLGSLFSAAELGKMVVNAVKTLVTSPP